MKNILLLIILFGAISSCSNNNTKTENIQIKEEIDNSFKVSFRAGSKNKTSKIYAAYTTDADSLWLNKEWVDEIEYKMKDLSKFYSTVLLFDSKDNVPNVELEGLNYSTKFDKHMICGYWKYSSNETKFCYGGVKLDGNFKECK